MRLEDRSAGRWCAECQQHGSHHTDKHAEFAPEPREDVAVAEVLAATLDPLLAGYRAHEAIPTILRSRVLTDLEELREALAPLITERVRAAAVEALREAADDVDRRVAANHYPFSWASFGAYLRDRADRRAER